MTGALLEGDLAARANAAIEAIAAAPELAIVPRDGVDNTSLATGAPGIALFHAHRGAALHDDAAIERAIGFHEACVASLDTRPAYLYDGWLGTAWITEQVFRDVLGDTEDLNEESDAQALAQLAATEQPAYELMYGLAGFGVYALARPDDSLAGARLLPRIVELLEREARETTAGLTWFTEPAQLRGDMSKVAPRGLYNASFAHGLGGLLAFLSRVARRPALAARAKPLARGLARWLVAGQLPPGSPFAFAAWAGDGVKAYERNHRLAWCYGDLPLSLALVQAGQAVDDPEVVAAGISAAMACAAPDRRADLVDIGLCHGALGVAHMFHRLYRATGVETLREAAVRFFTIAFDEYYVQGEGIGGTRAHLARQARELGLAGPWLPTPGLLYGAAGAGLALLSALHPSLTRWDGALLLDLAE